MNPRAERASRADERLHGLFEEALAGTGLNESRGLALVAVGGYGRSELSPASDLDVVLLHDDDVPTDVVDRIAERIWYPLWDDKDVALDHAVRDLRQMRSTADQDDRAAMGMLDARSVAGDSQMVLGLRSQILADWRKHATRRVAEMRSTRDARIARAGHLAHSAVPDLKESAGGLRDGVVLRALVATWLVDVPHAEVEQLRHELLDVRDALHQVSGRRSEKLDPSLIPDVAAALDTRPADLDLRVREVGRRIEHLSSLAWRRVDDALTHTERRRRITPKGPATRSLADGVALLDDEVIVAQHADPATDPEVALRAAAVAARENRPLSPGSAGRLARTMGDLPEPWEPSARRWMVDLLTAGEGLIRVWDELDFAGVIDRILPEWAEIRLRGSSSPVHQYTVDRHSLQAVVNAASISRDVARPDLLAVAALLHDIGKGREGDHSTVGEPMAVDIATRWGFDGDDAALIGRLVRLHLVLPDTATRRDIEDPETAEGIADLVVDAQGLELLAALTESDARATGPTAWTSWRRGLILGLIEKTAAVLADGVTTPDPADYEGWPMHVARPEVGETAPDDLDLTAESSRDGSLLTIVTADRPGVVAELAGGLALAGLSVRSARTVTAGDAAVSMWEVSRSEVDASVLAPRLKAALAGEVDLAARLVLPESDDDPVVRLLPTRTQTATVLEVRARDRRGLLWTVCHAITALGLGIRSAHLSTYGEEARDVLYVVDADGARLDDTAAAALRDGVAAALSR